MNRQTTLVQESDFIESNGRFLMPAQTLGEKIGFKNPRNSMSILWKRNLEELDPFSYNIKMMTPGGEQEVRAFDEQGCYIVAMLAKTEQAKAFRKALAFLLKKHAEQRKKAMLEVKLQQAKWELQQFLNHSKLWRTDKVNRFKELDPILSNSEMERLFRCSNSSITRLRTLLCRANGDFKDYQPLHLRGVSKQSFEVTTHVNS